MILQAAKQDSEKEFWGVVTVLRIQVDLYRMGLTLNDGKLKYFRKALNMERFYDVVYRVERTLKCDMFSSLHEIECMENAISNHDGIEMTVQCCMILHLCEFLCIPGGSPDPRAEHHWLFAPYKSLDEIAYLRSRLNFVRHSSYVRKAINISLIDAVHACFFDPTFELEWQGLLLVFREAGPLCSYSFLPLLTHALRERRSEIPKSALTLFLSYVSDVIFFLVVHTGNSVDSEEEELVELLFKLGASPMISREHHHVLFRQLEGRMHSPRPPWWLEVQDILPRSIKRFPTALNRLMAHEWTPDFLERLAQDTCCSLDSAGKHEDNYNKVNKVLSLQCLAAQMLPKSDLGALPPTLRFIASKHQPILIGRISRPQ